MTDQLDALTEMGFDPTGQTPLNPILEACIVETTHGFTFIKHPLVNDLYMPQTNARYNRALEYKLKARNQARADRQWHGYVFIHERPWRFEALTDIADDMDDRDFWQLVSDVWQDSENIRENQDDWDDLLRSDRPGRDAMMTDEERQALAELPETITIWQGHTDERDDGWSWTTDEAKAVWFAHRFANLEDGEAHLSTATCARADVTAYLLGRGESEILIDPDLVTLIRTDILEPRP